MELGPGEDGVCSLDDGWCTIIAQKGPGQLTGDSMLRLGGWGTKDRNGCVRPTAVVTKIALSCPKL